MEFSLAWEDDAAINWYKEYIRNMVLSWRDDHELSFRYTELEVLTAHQWDTGQYCRERFENSQQLAVKQNPESDSQKI